MTRGALAPRRHHRRRHRRQYRHRAGHRRQCAGLQDRDRHPRHPEPGKEGRAAPAGRRADRSAGGAVQEPQQLCEAVGPAGRAAGEDRNATARSGPTSSTMSPTARPISKAPGRKSGTRPAARSMASSAPSAPAARWAACRHGAEGAQSAMCRSPRPIRWARRSIAGSRPANWKAMAAPSPKASARAASPPTWKARRSTTPIEIPDEEALPIVFDLLEHEGLCMGGSTGINVAGAIRMAREMGPGHTIVTMLCDYGNRYQTKLFNPEFLREKGLPVPPWLVEQRAPIAVPFRHEHPGFHRMAGRASGRCAGGGCLLVHARRQARSARRIRSRAYSRRGVLRHRRHQRQDHRPAAHAAAAGRIRRGRGRAGHRRWRHGGGL